jgi:hypothetical protein
MVHPVVLAPMPDRMHDLMEAGGYVAVVVFTGLSVIVGGLAAVFRVGKKNLPIYYVSAERLSAIVGDAVEQRMEPYIEKFDSIQKRLDQGAMAISALEKQHAYDAGYRQAMLEKDRRQEGR